MTDKIKVRDTRRKGFYQIDNELLTEAGSILGPYGIAIYNAVVMCSWKPPGDRPSFSELAQLTGMSRRKAIYASQKLAELNIIRIESPEKKGKPNIITLLDKSDWNLPKDTAAHDAPPSACDALHSACDAPPSACDTLLPSACNALPSACDAPNDAQPAPGKPELPLFQQQTQPSNTLNTINTGNTLSAREIAPALAIHKNHFPEVTLKKNQEKEITVKATNLGAWEYTCTWFELQNYQGDKVGNLLDFYEKKAVPKFPAPAAESVNALPHPTGSEWEQIKKQLEFRIHRPSFNTWLRPLRAPIQHNGTVIIPVPDDVFQFKLKADYLRIFQDAYTTVRGECPEITFVVNPEVYDLEVPDAN